MHRIQLVDKDVQFYKSSICRTAAILIIVVLVHGKENYNQHETPGNTVNRKMTSYTAH